MTTPAPLPQDGDLEAALADVGQIELAIDAAGRHSPDCSHGEDDDTCACGIIQWRKKHLASFRAILKAARSSPIREAPNVVDVFGSLMDQTVAAVKKLAGEKDPMYPRAYAALSALNGAIVGGESPKEVQSVGTQGSGGDVDLEAAFVSGAEWFHYRIDAQPYPSQEEAEKAAKEYSARLRSHPPSGGQA